MASRLRRLVTAAHRAKPGRARHGSTGKHPADPWIAPGVVDEVRRHQLAGWLALPRGSDPALVELRAGRTTVTSTYTSPQEPADEQAGEPKRRRRRARRAWEAGAIPGRARFPRHSDGHELHRFSFNVDGLWPYVRRSTRIRVLVNGRPLPIAGQGMHLRPPVDGGSSPKALQEMLDRGYVLDKKGRLVLRKSLDTEWQAAVSDLYARVRSTFSDEGLPEPFLMYGTLLGAIREGGPIGHDDDLDVAYLSRARSGQAAAAELEGVATTLIHHGFGVKALRTHLHISDPADPSHKIDLFHCYFDEQDELALPFGVAGRTTLAAREWTGLTTMEFLGREVAVPQQSELLLTHLYGDDWRRPRPGFNWRRARTGRAAEGELSMAQRTRVHWADFYSRHEPDDGSPFSRFVLDRDDLPTHVIDIGCGDGRDSCALARADRTVLGLDASPEGVARAEATAQGLGVDERARFAVCDVADRDNLRHHLEQFVGTAGGAVMFYMRFFLHAIPQHVQDGLLLELAACARPGDVLAAEFRTALDEDTEKVHGQHYRRYQDAELLRKELGESHGFEIDHFDHGRGLSPFGDEDPVLCRILARRP